MNNPWVLYPYDPVRGSPRRTIEHRRDPMEDRGPEVRPTHEMQVIRRVRSRRGAVEDVVDGLVEDGDGASHAGDEEGLAAEERGDEGGHELSVGFRSCHVARVTSHEPRGTKIRAL